MFFLSFVEGASWLASLKSWSLLGLGFRVWGLGFRVWKRVFDLELGGGK